MKTAKELAIISVFTALLIGGQYALSFVSGVEVVTVLAVSFCYVFGVKRGALCMTAFSLLRCFIFGFFPNVVILYLVYYNLLAVTFGLIGKKLKNSKILIKLIVVVITSIILTVCFTLIDCVITPLFYQFTFVQANAYFLAYVPTLTAQIISVAVTVSALFIPLITLLKKITN